MLVRAIETLVVVSTMSLTIGSHHRSVVLITLLIVSSAVLTVVARSGNLRCACWVLHAVVVWRAIIMHIMGLSISLLTRLM